MNAPKAGRLTAVCRLPECQQRHAEHSTRRRTGGLRALSGFTCLRRPPASGVYPRWAAGLATPLANSAAPINGGDAHGFHR
jgi:hypothetical protein